MYWWSVDALDLDDSLNETIWTNSPSLQKAIFPHHPAIKEGLVIAAQALVEPVRPWVPDLVGREWEHEGGVLVMGISYADFFGAGST